MNPKTVTHTTIPAEPGWADCTPVFNADGDVVDVYQAPVIAWIVTFDTDCCHGEVGARWAQAVVADGMISTRDCEYLKRPDGRYVDSERTWYETREELIACMQEDEDRLRSQSEPYPWPTDAEVTPEQ